MFFIVKLIRDKAAKFKKDHGSGEDEKPFLEHLEDLRTTLFKLIITLAVVTVGTFIFNKPLLELIQFPLYMANIPPEARQLMTLGAVEGMMLAIKVSFFAGIVLSFPLLVFFLGEFILPGLKESEKKLVLPSLAIGALLFITGLCFSYFLVIPRALEFFYGFSTARGWGYDLRAGYYISFAVQMILVFGISFELPVVVMALVKLEILSHRVMRTTRSTAIVIMVIVSAVITPTTDVFTLSLLAGPLIILYEICIWMAWWLEKKRARAEELENKRSIPVATPLPDPDQKLLTTDTSNTSKGATASAAIPLTSTAVKDSDHVEPTTLPNYSDDNEFKETDIDQHYEPDITMSDEVSTPPPTTTPTTDTDHDTNHGHDDYGHSGDDYWNDPYHHDQHTQHDYYSGPIEELKRELREELTQQIKAELRIELLDQLRKELSFKPSKPTRISIDPRRTRRPK